jgi:hypothetical protein
MLFDKTSFFRGSASKGRLFNGKGKTEESKMYKGSCICVNSASGYVHIELQATLGSTEMLKAKEAFELMCRDAGVIPQEYLLDNGSNLMTKAFSENLLNQKALFAGVGAHHHNGIAERHVQTIMAIARSMTIHSAVHWPAVADPHLWPMAVRHAVYIWNRMPSEKNGLSPIDIFTRIRWPQAKFRDLNVWGCPVYVLNSCISGGKKIPQWEARLERSMYMGMSDWHSSTVPLVLNLESGAITPPFHVTFDDWFATVVADLSKFPDFDSPNWHALFGESAYQYIPSDDNDEVQAVPPLLPKLSK